MGEKERIKLKSLKLSGYKSFKSSTHPDEITFGDVNVIIGANGSGKSNLVSFFEMLNMMLVGQLQNYIATNGFADSLLYYGLRNTRTISIDLSFQNIYMNKYKFKLSQSRNDKLFFSEEILEHVKEKNDKTVFVPIELGIGHQESVLYSDHLDKQEDYQNIVKIVYYDYLETIKIFRFYDTSDATYMRRSVYIENEKELYVDGSNLAPFLYTLKNTPEYKKYYDRIIKRIRMIMPQFADLSLEPTTISKDPHISLNWKSLSNNEYILGPHQLSDGTLRFIALTTLLLQPPEKLPKIIIIDEPELGLHPSALSVLAGMIRTASLHSQVIIATQSTRLVDEFDCEDIIVAEWDTKGNSSKFKRLDKEQLGEWLENYSLSELWEKNVLGGQP